MEEKKVYSCYNCKHYNLFGDCGVPRPCEFRKNNCYNHNKCKHFEFAFEKDVPFVTKCIKCGSEFETVIKYMTYQRVCNGCIENKQNTIKGLVFYRQWKKCKDCMFFIQPFEEAVREDPGFCAINAPDHEESVQHMTISRIACRIGEIELVHSNSYSAECPYFA